MNLSKLNEWTGIISNIGVLLGIIFLIIEISQNTRAIESEVIWAHAAVATDIYTSDASNLELASNYQKISDMGAESALELRNAGAPEMFMYGRTQIARVNYWQARYLTQTSDADRGRLRNSIVGGLQSEATIAIMSSVQNTLHPEFSAYLGDIIRDLSSQEI